MSEKSFAITSISAAIICGTFFYPPPPADASSVKVQPAAVSATASQKPVPAQKMALLTVADTSMQTGESIKLTAASPEVQAWAGEIAVVGK